MTAEPTPRTFVLVHGAWHGGWCWRRVADRLRARGHRVFAPTLTGLAERAHLLEAGLTVSLSTHIADIAGLFEWEELSDVVLCGHSYGGMVVSGVAERLASRPGAIAALVYLDAFVAENGQSALELAAPERRAAMDALIASGAATMPQIPAAVYCINESDRAWVDARCTPQPLATLTEPAALTGARERIARKVYVRAANYPNPGFEAIRARLADQPGWRVLDLPCGHDVMVDLPEQTVEILEAA